MVKIYISSTYSDLKEYREAVYHSLRRMRHDVIAMEDYVATDQRPVDQCLADVAACDLYVGIFAWRYGYIPSEDNPEQKSITEMEYRKASEVGKPRLIFILDEHASWSVSAMDQVTGEGDHGRRITELRQELKQKLLISTFKTPDELAALVSSAVYLWEKSQTNSANKYYMDIMATQTTVLYAQKLFSEGKDVYRDQCDRIVKTLSTISEPVQQFYKLLDTSAHHQMAVGSLSYPLVGALHDVDDLVNELVPLIIAFSAICRKPSKQMKVQRQEIHRKLDALVQSLQNVKDSFGKLVGNPPNQIQSVKPGSNDPQNGLQIPVTTPSIPAPLSNLFDPTVENQTRLREAMHLVYSQPDFYILCRDFGVNYDDLPGTTLKLKMQDLIDYFVHRDKYEELVRKVLAERPNIKGKL